MILAGCSESIIELDYDTEADFANLNTYGWLADSEISQENELAAKRIKNAVNRELAAKGLTKVSENVKRSPRSLVHRVRRPCFFLRPNVHA